jgi:hypothetical protein
MAAPQNAPGLASNRPRDSPQGSLDGGVCIEGVSAKGAFHQGGQSLDVRFGDAVERAEFDGRQAQLRGELLGAYRDIPILRA